MRNLLPPLKGRKARCGGKMINDKRTVSTRIGTKSERMEEIQTEWECEDWGMGRRKTVKKGKNKY
jgi:hypothetical protein